MLNAWTALTGLFVKPIKVRAVIFKEGDWWVGQYLEYDIAAQAKTVNDLIYELQRTLVAHIVINKKEGREPFANLEQAPKRYWNMFYQGIKVLPEEPKFNTPWNVPMLEPELHLVTT